MDERGQREETPPEHALSGVAHEDKPWLGAPLPTPEVAALLRGWLWGDPSPAAAPAMQPAA